MSNLYTANLYAAQLAASDALGKATAEYLKPDLSPDARAECQKRMQDCRKAFDDADAAWKASL